MISLRTFLAATFAARFRATLSLMTPMTKRLIHLLRSVPMVAFLVACESTSTEAVFTGIATEVTSVTNDSVTYSVSVRVENLRPTSVWVSECYTLQRSRGGAWQDLTSLSAGCPTSGWPILAGSSVGLRVLSLPLRIADSLLTPDDSLRAVFGVSSVGPSGGDARAAYSRSFTLAPVGH